MSIMYDVAALYRSLASYSDHGHVFVEAGGMHTRDTMTGLVHALSFQTMFTRNHRFEFRVRREVDEVPSAMEVVAASGSVTVLWRGQERAVASVAEALAAMSISTFGTSVAVTSLLMPDELGRGSLLLDSVVWSPFLIESQGTLAAAPRRTHVLFDCDTKLIRRIVRPIDPRDEDPSLRHGNVCRRCIVELYPDQPSV